MRLLFVKLRHIGDALVLTPTLAAVRQLYPEATIWVVVRRGSEGILAGCPAVDRVVTAMVPEHGAERRQHRGRDWLLPWTLRRQRFDHVFELGGGDRGRWLAALSGARRQTLNISGRKVHRFWKLLFNAPARTKRYGHHQVLWDYLTVRDILPLPAEVPPLQFDPAATRPWKPAEDLSDFGVLHVWTRWPEKAWPLDRWAAVGRHLLSQLPALVLSCGPGAGERDAVAGLAAELGPRALSTDGATDWAQLAGLLRRARLFAGVDTAAMHLAAACQCPTVALFGPSGPFEWRPWRNRHVLLRPDQWLGPAVLSGPREAIMTQIPVERVAAACDLVLAGGGEVFAPRADEPAPPP